MNRYPQFSKQDEPRMIDMRPAPIRPHKRKPVRWSVVFEVTIMVAVALSLGAHYMLRG